jgi:hypothetical protein
VCCDYLNRTHCTSAVVLQCSYIPIALSPCYIYCYSSLHTSQTPASASFLEPTVRVFKHHSTFNNIAPTTRSKSLHAELIATFHNPLFNIDTNLFEDTPSNQATHNTLSPLHSPLFSPSEIPSPNNSV